MARFFIMGFVPNSEAHCGVVGFYNDKATNQFASVVVNDIPYDPTSPITLRQQILDNVISHVGYYLDQAGITYAPLIPTDIEIVS